MNFIAILIIVGTLISNERQNNLENHIQCPCKKGMLSDHASPSAMKLKTLIGELIKDPIQLNSIQKFIRETTFVSNNRKTQNDENVDHQICLINSIEKNIHNNKISDKGVYSIIGECYGQHLIRKNENNSIIYAILFSLILIGLIFSSWFIFINKKREL